MRCRIPNCNKLAVGGSLQLCRTHNTGGEQGIILDSSHGDYEDGESLQDELSLTRIQRSSSDHTEGEEPAAKKLKNA